MADWLSISTADPFWFLKSLFLVLGVASLPVIVWDSLQLLVRRCERRRAQKANDLSKAADSAHRSNLR